MALYIDLGDPFLKGMTIKKLKELLDTLPEDDFISVNSVENLIFFEADDEGKPTALVGWVDMSNEDVKYF